MATRVHTENNRPLATGRPSYDVRQAAADPEMEADWSAYAATYDLLLEHNPAYQDLLKEFESILTEIEPPRVIYDVGGGTGNYSQIAAKWFPDSTIYFVEPDRGMAQHAKEKLSGHDNIVFIDRPLQEVEAAVKADLVICAHALYAMPDHEERLADLRNLLRPGGQLFLLDLGRPMDVADWRSFIFSHMRKEIGLVKALKVLWKGREIAKQNKAILKAQQDGVYWTHSESEICSAVENTGFEVTTQKKMYRGYSDLLMCRAKPLRHKKEAGTMQKVLDTLEQCRYSIVTDGNDLERVYRLRYDSYRAEDAILKNERGMMSDSYDESSNCVHVAVEMDGEYVAALRLHVFSSEVPVSPTLDVFPELWDLVKSGKSMLDPTRFVVKTGVSKNFLPLHLVTLRIPFLGAVAYDVDFVLAAVRAEHGAFYRRYLRCDHFAAPRAYPGLTKPITLMMTDLAENRDKVLARYPFFGHVDSIPQSEIHFPQLPGMARPIAQPGKRVA